MSKTSCQANRLVVPSLVLFLKMRICISSVLPCVLLQTSELIRWLILDIFIDVIAILSARKAKSRAQLTTMRTTVAYTRTKHCFMLDYHSIANASLSIKQCLVAETQLGQQYKIFGMTTTL